MGRNIIAGIVGVVLAFGIVLLSDMIGHAVYPVPPEFDFTDTDAARSYIASLPIGAFAFVAGGWFVATLLGVIAACRIGTAQPIVFTMVIGGLMLAATTFNLVTIPHPVWFSITGIAGIVAAAWLGLKISARKDDVAAT